MTVYLLHPIREQPPGPEWGELSYINQRFVYPDELKDDHRLPAGFLLHIRAAASAFRPGEDFFCMTGDYMQTAAFLSALAVRHDYFDILTFDRKLQAYVWSRHSGLVSLDQPVVSSLTDTGNEHGQDRKQSYNRPLTSEAIQAALPLNPSGLKR